MNFWNVSISTVVLRYTRLLSNSKNVWRLGPNIDFIGFPSLELATVLHYRVGHQIEDEHNWVCMAVLLGPGMVSAGFGEKNFIIIIIISIIIIIVVIVIDRKSVV